MRSISLAALLVGLLCVPAAADAAVAYDAFTVCSNSTTDPVVCSHTPTGTPRAILVYVFQNADATDQVVSCTYGGDAMTEVTGSPNAKAAAEAFIIHAFFLGTSIPTGAQDVSCDVSNTTAKRVSVISLTAAADTELVDQDATINSDSVTDPSVTLSLSGRTSFAALGAGSGHNEVGVDPNADPPRPASGWTSRTEVDNGTTALLVYTYDTISTVDVAATWVQTTEDAIAIAVAISETAAATKKCPGLLLGFQGCL
jgi:hypothetical protein